jgi:hypothetical protein
MSDHIAKIQAAIMRLHDCESRHVGAIPVQEVYQPCGRPMPAALTFAGVVEVFMLTDHKTARVCFAWIAPEACASDPVIVLEGQYHKHVNDPHSAVRAWMRYELGPK